MSSEIGKKKTFQVGKSKLGLIVNDAELVLKEGPCLLFRTFLATNNPKSIIQKFSVKVELALLTSLLTFSRRRQHEQLVASPPLQTCLKYPD